MTTAAWTRWQVPVDSAVVSALRSEVAAELARTRQERAEKKQPLSAADEGQLGRSLIRRAVERHELVTARDSTDDARRTPHEHRRALTDAVYAALFGLGRLQPLLDDPEVTNIDATGFDRVFVTLTDGQVVPGPSVADSDVELIELVRNAATYTGLSSRAWDDTHPWVELRLPDGSRLCAMMSVCARPTVSIRCYRSQRITLDDLQRRGAFTTGVRRFLTDCVAARMNVIVSGETFAGKTTLLRALANEIPPEERLVTAEHFRELGLGEFADLHRDVVELEERDANAEGKGAMPLVALVERARRLNPDRLIVGEVIGGEIAAMLDAMTQGEDGSLSTIHARNAATVFDRISLYALYAGVPIETSQRLIAAGLDFVVHVSMHRAKDGRVHRYIASIREVAGFDGRQVLSSEVFAEGPDFTQVPAAAITETRSARLRAVGGTPAGWAAA
jgi:Flp pilus assembly CpaF family ATPase